MLPNKSFPSCQSHPLSPKCERPSGILFDPNRSTDHTERPLFFTSPDQTIPSVAFTNSQQFHAVNPAISDSVQQTHSCATGTTYPQVQPTVRAARPLGQPNHAALTSLQPSTQITMGFNRLFSEMKARQFDSIRFAAYRTACKLRYIQQRTLFCFIELWRVIETFRDFGLHQITDNNASLDYASTNRLLARVYTHITVPSSLLFKPGSQPPAILAQNLISAASEIMLSWLVHALDVCGSGRLMVNSLKVALSTLTNAKPTDKFRYHFTFISDPSGALIPGKFDAYLKDLLRLPISVFEGLNFSYTPQAAQTIMTGKSKSILIEEFVDRMCADPGAQLLVWLTIFHRLSSVEGVRHNVRCEGCKREPVHGLRYKCTRCAHYNLCQDCFWTGVTTDQHTNTHDVKEYSSSSKSHSRQFGHSLRKSFQFSKLTGGNASQSNKSTTGQSVQTVIGRATVNQECKRPPLGAIFEWNSAPASVNFSDQSKNGGFPINPVMNNSAEFNPVTQSRFPMMLLSQKQPYPISSLRSPIPHRRLQQLNPMFLSSPVTQKVQTSGPPVSEDFVVLYQAPTSVELPKVTASSAAREVNCTSAWVMKPNSLGSVNEAPPGADPFNCHIILNSPLNVIPSSVVQLNEPATLSEAAANSPRRHNQTQNSAFLSETGQPKKNVSSTCSEEHQLIAKYAAQLAAVSAFSTDPEKFENIADSPQTQKQLIAELQAKNKKIMREIERLRVEQQKQAAVIAAAGSSTREAATEQDHRTGPLSPTLASHSTKFEQDAKIQQVGENPKLVSELHILRQRKEELETRMNNLQRNRTELTLQLETLIRLLSLSAGNTRIVNPRQRLPTYSGDSSRTTVTGSMMSSTVQAHSDHQSRHGTRGPSYPPKRCSSLSQTIDDRVCWLGGLTSACGPNDDTHDKLPGLPPGQNEANQLQTSLLSPVQDLIKESLIRYGEDKPTSVSFHHNDEGSEHRLQSGRMALSKFSNDKRLFTCASPHKGFSDNERPNRANEQHESGSEAYLYSDPEVCGLGGSSSIPRGARQYATHKQPPGSSNSGASSIADNYEYANAIRTSVQATGKSRTLDGDNMV